MKNMRKILAALLITLFVSSSAYAKVEIQWWHAFGGRLGELLNEQVEKFNA